MRLIIAGPRDLTPTYGTIAKAINESGFTSLDAIVSGWAEGVDKAAADWASYHGIQPIIMPALWKYFKRQGNVRVAGPLRNANMAKVGDALLVIKRKGIHTKGTSNMIYEATKAELPIYIYELEVSANGY